MLSTLLTLSALTTLTLAQSTTVSLLLPDADPQSLVGSIAGSDASATTYVIQCASNASGAGSATANNKRQAAVTTAGSANGGCGFPSPITVVQGPSTLHYTYSANGNAAGVDCKLAGTTQAVCTGGINGPGASGISSVQTATLTGSDLPPFSPVLITGGVGNAKGSGAGATTTGSAGKAGSTGSSSGTSSGTSSGAAPQSTKSAAVGRVGLTMGMGIVGVAVGIAAVLL